MDTNDVKKYIEKQKQSFICKVLLNNKEYFQAIKERDIHTVFPERTAPSQMIAS